MRFAGFWLVCDLKSFCRVLWPFVGRLGAMVFGGLSEGLAIRLGFVCRRVWVFGPWFLGLG